MAKVSKFLYRIEPCYVGVAFGTFLSVEYDIYDWEFWALFLPVLIIWVIIRKMARGSRN